MFILIRPLFITFIVFVDDDDDDDDAYYIDNVKVSNRRDCAM